MIKLSRLFDVVGEQQEFSCEIAPDDLRDYKTDPFASPVRLSGRVFNRAGIVTLEYVAEFTQSHCCDRCLKEFTRDYSFRFSHVLVRSLDSTVFDERFVECGNDMLDEKELAVSDILLELPAKILCREDCRGLCPVCGCDLNTDGCSCGGAES